MIPSLDSSSVLSKLLKDSLITNMEPGVSDGQHQQHQQQHQQQQHQQQQHQQKFKKEVDENLNITNVVTGDCKYYF